MKEICPKVVKTSTFYFDYDCNEGLFNGKPAIVLL